MKIRIKYIAEDEIEVLDAPGYIGYCNVQCQYFKDGACIRKGYRKLMTYEWLYIREHQCMADQILSLITYKRKNNESIN